MQPPIITFRLDEPYNHPGEGEAGLVEDEDLELTDVMSGNRAESAASPPGPGASARGGAHFPSQPPLRLGRLTEWIMAVSMLALSLAAAYYAVTSRRNSRSQYQLAVSSTQAALTVAHESTQAAQQAWVGLLLPTADPLSKEGGGFAIKLRNFGKTPALNVRITDYVAIEDLDHLDGMQEEESNRPMAAGTLMPDSEFDTEVGFRTSLEGVTSLAQGKVRAVNYALITYEDIYHRRHITQSCFYWHGGLHAPLPCDRFNTVE